MYEYSDTMGMRSTSANSGCDAYGYTCWRALYTCSRICIIVGVHAINVGTHLINVVVLFIDVHGHDSINVGVHVINVRVNFINVQVQARGDIWAWITRCKSFMQLNLKKATIIKFDLRAKLSQLVNSVTKGRGY
jgi:hypothetical protein